MTLTSDICELNITGLTADSRAVKPGFLFAAMPGSTVDGREFTTSALQNGAVAILSPEGTDAPKEGVFITAQHPRAAFSQI
ncbi:MAG: Mur ligase domain-containing protein [Pseudomonadota bacterium]|nr:Mur ligase domain-containing protein [Pseudomonadota bacterium]